MSKQPPNDDELLEAIFEQLQNAMAETDAEEDAEIQEELMTGIRHSLQALFGGSMDFKPQVTVMDGGKTEETDADSKRPELHFAPDPPPPTAVITGGSAYFVPPSYILILFIS